MNEIFSKLITGKIEQFESDFLNISRQVFVDKDGKLRHPGEFGMYREKIVAEFLKPFLPTRLAIGSGFIITDKNNISSQCDIIIYDKEHTPIIENTEQRFFPIETVVGVIEVKSILNKTQLEEALIKLSKIKNLRYDISKKPYVYKDSSKKGLFDPKCIYDQIATFIICEQLSFDIRNDAEEFFSGLYKNIDRSLFHNMILCLDKNCYLYNSDENVSIYCAYFDYYKGSTFKNKVIFSNENDDNKEHIRIFLDYFHMLISSISTFYIDMTRYLWDRSRFTYIDQIKKSNDI